MRSVFVSGWNWPLRPTLPWLPITAVTFTSSKLANMVRTNFDRMRGPRFIACSYSELSISHCCPGKMSSPSTMSPNIHTCALLMGRAVRCMLTIFTTFSAYRSMRSSAMSEL